MNSMCHLYNLCPKTAEKLFLDKGNMMKNTLDASTYFINQ